MTNKFNYEDMYGLLTIASKYSNRISYKNQHYALKYILSLTEKKVKSETKDMLRGIAYLITQLPIQPPIDNNFIADGCEKFNV